MHRNSPRASVHTDRTQYVSGDTVQLTLRNLSSAQLKYAHCPVLLMHETSAGWKFVPERFICNLLEYNLGGGDSGLFKRRLPAAIEPGRYRLEVESVHEIASPRSLPLLPADDRTSNTFSVRQ